MSSQPLSHDEKWPRANSLFTQDEGASQIALVGIPASQSSLSPTSAHLTPAAIRAALARYSTFAGSSDGDLSTLSMVDLGDVESPDFDDGEARVGEKLKKVRERHELLLALGGDNSITYSVARALWLDLSQIGIITFDAHHDLRDGKSNGSPVWRLIQAGVPGKNIVQIGIADFANSKAYSDRARENGVTVITRNDLRERSIASAVESALRIAGAEGREIYVDVDVDICDRAVVPACPASMPGGISADELRQAVRAVASHKKVRAIDFTEIDASLDAPDQRTIRLAALLVLEAAAGFAAR